jgi:hypothetical protein
MNKSPRVGALVRVVLTLNMTFDQDLVVLQVILSMFGRFVVHSWRWCGGMNKEHPMPVH